MGQRNAQYTCNVYANRNYCNCKINAEKLARNCSHQNANAQCCTQLQGIAQPTKDKKMGPLTAGTNAASTTAGSAIAREK